MAWRLIKSDRTIQSLQPVSACVVVMHRHRQIRQWRKSVRQVITQTGMFSSTPTWRGALDNAKQPDANQKMELFVLRDLH